MKYKKNKNRKVLAIIPARGGSKSIHKKNIRKMALNRVRQLSQFVDPLKVSFQKHRYREGPRRFREAFREGKNEFSKTPVS